jgi:hypothetical protein
LIPTEGSDTSKHENGAVANTAPRNNAKLPPVPDFTARHEDGAQWITTVSFTTGFLMTTFSVTTFSVTTGWATTTLSLTTG